MSPLSISYDLAGAGWATCLVEVAGERVELTASYVSDALGNLLLSALAITSGYRALEFGFDEEPGEFRWALTIESANTVRVGIYKFDQLWGHKPIDEGRPLITFVATPISYAKAIRDAASDVLSKYGPNRYAEDWQYAFPQRTYEMLGELLESRPDAA